MKINPIKTRNHGCKYDMQPWFDFYYLSDFVITFL